MPGAWHYEQSSFHAQCALRGSVSQNKDESIVLDRESETPANQTEGCCGQGQSSNQSASPNSLPVVQLNDAQPSAISIESADKGMVVENAVFDRYAAAANAVEQSLCCPVDYSGIDMTHIPDEVMQRDYGCGNPAPYVRPGDTVLDLGSGGGKICFATAKIVGPKGRVIGVDCNKEMLALARKHAPSVAESLGFSNVQFHFGMIQDLKLDLEQLTNTWKSKPVNDAAEWMDLKKLEQSIRDSSPMIQDGSVDTVISNCVLNLVRHEDRRQLFAEIFRVLREGGLAAISDIVCDEDVPERLQQDSTLWSGCISGAFREDRFLDAFKEAGFGEIEIATLESDPWQTVEGIEFRSMTVLARKPSTELCWDRKQAVIYRGPHQKIVGDDGSEYVRGQRTAVCDRTYRWLKNSSYADSFIYMDPLEDIPLEDAVPFDCGKSLIRSPRETKGENYRLTTGVPSNDDDSSCCGGSSCC